MRSLVLRLVGFFVLALSLVGAAAAVQEPPATEEIPIERCDRLPVIRVRIDGEEMRFLVDTAATSMLNLKSFSQKGSKETRRAVSSWSGTAAIRAREISLGELALGNYRLHKLKLPAIDLSAIGEACGGRIDGILGVDLLERMGATLDLKRRVALLPSETASATEKARIEEFRTSQRACIAAFNRVDAHFFEGCIDPQVVLLTPWGEVRGRREMLDYLRRRYFSLDPPARLELRVRDFRLLGDAVWYGYDYTMKLPEGLIKARGTAMCRRVDGCWRMLYMHNSLAQKEDFQQP